MSGTRERGARYRHAGRWVLLDARLLRLLSIGSTAYPGTSPRAALDPIARRILLPRMRAASLAGAAISEVAADQGHRWNVRVEPVVGPKSGQLLAVWGCYWDSESTMPEAPPIGSWEYRVSPPGSSHALRAYWAPGLFTVHARAIPAGAGPHEMDSPQWLDGVVMEADRAQTRLLHEDLATSTTDTVRFHTYRIRDPHTGAEHHIRSAIWRDATGPSAEVWLRAVSTRTAQPEPGTDSGRVATRYLDAMLALLPDPVFAIDTAHEQLFLTTARFAELNVVLPRNRHLSRICHPDDLAALRAMLVDAATHTDTVAGPLRVRVTGPNGWTPLELCGVAVHGLGATPRHVLCLVHSAGRLPTEQAA